MLEKQQQQQQQQQQQPRKHWNFFFSVSSQFRLPPEPIPESPRGNHASNLAPTSSALPAPPPSPLPSNLSWHPWRWWSKTMRFSAETPKRRRWSITGCKGASTPSKRPWRKLDQPIRSRVWQPIRRLVWRRLTLTWRPASSSWETRFRSPTSFITFVCIIKSRPWLFTRRRNTWIWLAGFLVFKVNSGSFSRTLFSLVLLFIEYNLTWSGCLSILFCSALLGLLYERADDLKNETPVEQGRKHDSFSRVLLGRGMDA